MNKSIKDSYPPDSQETIHQVTLDEEQTQAVQSTGHCLICASPGSGKTTVLAHRSKYLLVTNPSAKILAVTFGRHAATELNQRILNLVPSAASRIVCGTFHKMAKMQFNAAGMKTNIIYDIHRIELIQKILLEFGLHHLSAEGVSDTIDYAKARGELHNFPSEVQPVFDRYTNLLKERELMDLQDLILRSVEGIKSDIVKPIKANFILVDEVQDADTNQWEWLTCHADQGCQITAVGDDDQSIYAWRSAQGYPGMKAFSDRYQAKQIFLQSSYRCPQNILEKASRLVALNGSRFEKQTISRSQIRGEISLVESLNSEDESKIITQQIIVDSKRGTCAILARAGFALDEMEVALTVAGVPHKRVDSKSLWDRPGAALFLSYLQGLDADKFDGLEPLLLESGCILNNIDDLRRRCAANTSGSATRFAHLQDVSATKANKFIIMIQESFKKCRKLIKENNLSEMFFEAAATVKEISSARELMVITLCQELLAKLEGSLSHRLIFLRQKKKLEMAPVMLMTMHASKGLEFDFVYIVGCHYSSFEDRFRNIQEERRLWFVAMTRARIKVTISNFHYALRQTIQFVQEMELQQGRPIFF